MIYVTTQIMPLMIVTESSFVSYAKERITGPLTMRCTFILQRDLSTTMHNLISTHLIHNKPSLLLGVKFILPAHIAVTLIMRPKIAFTIPSVILVESFSVVISLCVEHVEVTIRLPNTDNSSDLDFKLELSPWILKRIQAVRPVEVPCIPPLTTMNLITSKGEKIQATKAREPTKKWVHKKN